MQNQMILAAATAALLAGCSGSGPEKPKIVTSGDLPGTFLSDYDAAADTVTLSNGTTAVVLPRYVSYDGTRFRGYYRPALTGSDFALLAETPSGDGYALSALSPTQGMAGSEFARLAATSVPGGGTATYSGEYGALIVSDSSGTVYALLFGDIDLAADFGADTISGTISNRVDWAASSITYADVILAPASISGGGFGGSTSGGDGTGAIVSTASAGSYSGLITGANGGEVVGGVTIGHTIGAGAYTEFGAFVAD